MARTLAFPHRPHGPVVGERHNGAWQRQGERAIGQRPGCSECLLSLGRICQCPLVSALLCCLLWEGHSSERKRCSCVLLISPRPVHMWWRAQAHVP